jgi:hypothetical protein
MDPGFRLVTYNVNSAPWTTTPIKQIVAWLVSHADIAALQAVWYRHTEWSAAFAAHGWVFLQPARESHFASVFGSGLAVAWPSGRWTLQDARLYPFLNTIGVDHAFNKSWFRVDLFSNSDAKPLRLINAQLQEEISWLGTYCLNLTSTVRELQSQQLYDTEMRMLRSQSVPTILASDSLSVFDGQIWQKTEIKVGPETEDWAPDKPKSWHLIFRKRPLQRHSRRPGKPSLKVTVPTNKAESVPSQTESQ